jgi:glycosyltransferase involved in cell wall biosynthesis
VLSVVIATHDSERPLLPTLAALVPGAAAGTVREVIVADAGSHDATAEIADVAGCRLLVSDRPRGARLKAAAATARSGWLLFLMPGVIPDVTWVDETRRFAERTDMQGLALKQTAAFRAGSGLSPSLLTEAFNLMRRAVGARPLPQQGLLVSKRLYDELGGHDENSSEPESDLYRRLGRRRIVLLRTSASVLAD